ERVEDGPCLRGGAPLHGLGHERGGGDGDGAAVAVEADVAHALAVQLEVQRQAIPAQRVEPLEPQVGALENAEVPGAAVVIDDDLLVEVLGVHHRANTLRAFSMPAMSRSTSACVL